MKRVLVSLFVFAFFICPDRPVLATDLHKVLTDYVITSWNNKEGLPPGVVWALAQDADG